MERNSEQPSSKSPENFLMADKPKQRYYSATEKKQIRAESNQMYRMGLTDLREADADIGADIMLINVGGSKHWVSVDTLLTKPHTRLGKLAAMHRYSTRHDFEYFFDQHSLAFFAVLDYYRSGRYKGRRTSGRRTDGRMDGRKSEREDGR